MTPKEKAVEFYYRFTSYAPLHSDNKQCALIAVDELINCTPSVDMYPPNFQTIHPRVREFWKQVKQEIEKL
jgi:hypothetical protein